MSITSTTTTQTTHRATLAGGITVSINHGTFGATLTLFESGRAMTLALTPEQVGEMAQWSTPDSAPPYLADELPCDWIAQDVQYFTETTRLRARLRFGDIDAAIAADIATLRALARAYQETPS